ncbi:MAG: ATP phosphoribosyltransferase [Proteobacteria bacterium]|nr:ATP phosphoribosyltransferase [Pseudomonadota bacterium]
MSLLRLAIQKSGRLTEDSRTLIAECGIELDYVGAKLRAAARNFPVELLFLRDDDMPRYCADGVIDAAIVGQNILLEQELETCLVRELGFGRCRLAIATLKGFPYRSIESLQGLKIATSYPNILGKFLRERGVRASIHEISGSVEVAPSLGLGEAICDLVSSGSTLLSNGLVEVETVAFSQAALVCSPRLAEEKRKLLDQLLFRIDAVLRAGKTKYITLNAPNEALPGIVRLLPGLKSPSILPLALPGWSSLHTVVSEDDFWGRIESLRAAGAQGILVLPIEKVIV